MQPIRLEPLWTKVTLLTMLPIVLSGCSSPVGMELAELDLPGQVVVHNAKDNLYLRYTEDKDQPFLPLKPQPQKPLYDTVFANESDVSPDGKWKVAFDKKVRRWMVVGPSEVKHHFKFFSVGPEMDWSPDSQFVVYRANVDENEWGPHVFVLNLKTGTTAWIGKGGGAPRWFPDDVVLN